MLCFVLLCYVCMYVCTYVCTYGVMCPRNLGWGMPTEEQLRVPLVGLHLKGFVHLDVKPDNFAYSRKGKLLLLDFGCCLRPPVYVPELVGTFAFAARALHGASQEAPVQVNSDLDFESLKFVTRFCFCFFYVVGFVVWVFCFFCIFWVGPPGCC